MQQAGTTNNNMNGSNTAVHMMNLSKFVLDIVLNINLWTSGLL